MTTQPRLAGIIDLSLEPNPIKALDRILLEAREPDGADTGSFRTRDCDKLWFSYRRNDTPQKALHAGNKLINSMLHDVGEWRSRTSPTGGRTRSTTGSARP